MPSWGGSANNEKQPDYLTTTEKRSCYATSSGWVFLQPDGSTEEILVAIRGLSGSNSSTGIGASQVTEIYLNTRSANSDNVTLNVVFNEKVYVSGNTPYIQITGNNSFAGGDGKADYISGNGTNILVFSYAPASGDDVGSPALANTIVLGTNGLIVDSSNTGVINSINAAGYNGSVDVRPDILTEKIIA